MCTYGMLGLSHQDELELFDDALMGASNGFSNGRGQGADLTSAQVRACVCVCVCVCVHTVCFHIIRNLETMHD